MAQARTLQDVLPLKGFDAVCVTGGEPMLEPYLTLGVISHIRKCCETAKVYLYTALAHPMLEKVLDVVDGMQFSLHEGSGGAEIDGLKRIQAMIAGRTGSYRLYVEPSVECREVIRQSLWNRIEIKSWLSEQELLVLQPNGLPPGERLFILDRA